MTLDERQVTIPAWSLSLVIGLVCTLLGGAAAWSVYAYRLGRMEETMAIVVRNQGEVLAYVQHAREVEKRNDDRFRQAEADRLSEIHWEQQIMMVIVRTHPGIQLPGIINERLAPDPFRMRGIERSNLGSVP